MTRRQKRDLGRILSAAALWLPLFVLHLAGKLEVLPWWAELLLFLAPYLVVGFDVIWKAGRNIAHGQVFDENFLMLLATVGAFATGEYAEAVAVMLFYQVGELFQSYAVGKSRQSIADLMDICPEFANIEEEGQLVQVDPDDVEIGTEIVIRPGERIPLDGVVVEGAGLIDTAALTGESVPRRVAPGDGVISGCVNGGATLRVRITKAFEDSTVTKILELVENASSKKARTESFITRFARYYTPIVTIGAVLLGVLPPLLFGEPWGQWLHRACVFLVISCPCALVISVPMGFFGGIGAASKNGILVKGSNYLEQLAAVDTLVFDKTGTLTRGEFRVTEVCPAPGVEQGRLLELAALAEGYSNHPIAAALRAACAVPLDRSCLSDVEELAGRGVRATLDGKALLVGSEAHAGTEAAVIPNKAPATVVYAAYDGQFLGSILISDSLKPGAEEALREMRRLGVHSCVMLTGDRREAAEAMAAQLGIDQVRAELLPGDKVACVEELLAAQKKGGKLAFVGDGINDAPVLSRADVGIAMGSLGSDAAIEAADVVLMDDDLKKLSAARRIARKTLVIVRQNIVFALAVKAAVLALGALGLAGMWEAVFADVGVAVLAILNAMRVLKAK